MKKALAFCILAASVLALPFVIYSLQGCSDAHAGDADPRATEMIDAAVTPSPTTSGLDVVLGNGSTADITSDQIALTSTATSGNELSITATPGSARTDPIMILKADGTAWAADSEIMLLDNDDGDGNLVGLTVRGAAGGKHIKFETSGGIEFAGFGLGSTNGFQALLLNDLSAGDGFSLDGAAAGELTASTAITQNFMHLNGYINQNSGAGAGYNILGMEWTETNVDSGAHRGIYVNAPTGFTGDLARFDVNGGEKFAVSSEGYGDFAGGLGVGGNTTINGNNVNLKDLDFIYGYQDCNRVALGSNTYNNWAFTLDGNKAKDHDHTLSSTPTVFFQSELDPDVSNQEWGSITHDGTDFTLTTGGPAAGTGSAPTTIPNRIKIDGPILITGETIKTPSATLDITAATGLTAATHLIYSIVRIQSVTAGNEDITANPQIADGTDGQILIIQGDHDTKTVQFDDGNGLQLAGAASFTAGQGDVLQLMFDAGDDAWIEISRSNN